jgi:hypothetical protein
MIRYDLRCVSGHEFDGWYRDSDAFAKLKAASLLECPFCGSTDIDKRLMTPSVRKARGVKGRPVQAPPETLPAPAPSRPAPAPPGARAVAGPMPAQLMAMLQRMRAEVEKHCEYVGPAFAEEARKLHRGESDRKGIYGEATEAEADALREEGLEIGHLPWVPRAES